VPVSIPVPGPEQAPASCSSRPVHSIPSDGVQPAAGGVVPVSIPVPGPEQAPASCSSRSVHATPSDGVWPASCNPTPSFVNRGVSGPARVADF